MEHFAEPSREQWQIDSQETQILKFKMFMVKQLTLWHKQLQKIKNKYNTKFTFHLHVELFTERINHINS